MNEMRARLIFFFKKKGLHVKADFKKIENKLRRVLGDDVNFVFLI